MNLTSSNKCILCGRNIGFNEFENHVREDHMLTYSKYYEYYKLVNENFCNICDEAMYRVSPWFDIYNSCINCSGYKLYYESVMMNIDKIHRLLCSNMYLKLFILNKNLREKLTHFNLLEYCSVLAYRHKSSDIKDDINLFSIDTMPGMSPYINLDMNNVKLSKSKFNITKREMIMCCGENYSLNIGSNKYGIYLPEECEYHNNNHYKYNILNRSNNCQSAKKLLLSSGTCIKLYNTNLDKCKSILRVTKNGRDIYSTFLTTDELDYIKFYIMSNPVLLRHVLNIIYEIERSADTIYDYAFLLNKLTVNPNGKFDMIIDWTVNNKMSNSSNELLSLSIL